MPKTLTMMRLQSGIKRLRHDVTVSQTKCRRELAEDFGFGTQIRKSPYFDATVRWGAKDFSVYNHMYIPRDFGDPVQNFWNLVNEAILCDVDSHHQCRRWLIK